MQPSRIYYVRISDDRQDFLRQINGLREMAKRNGDEIPERLWKLVQDQKPVPIDSPVLWDHGSRDMAEKRPNFQHIIGRVEGQQPNDPKRLQEICIYELDRFGVTDCDEWFHYRYVFNKHGAKITSWLKGELTAKNDLKTIIETLFESENSKAEQKKIAGRVAAQMAGMAVEGRFLGGVPRFGYDLGCFDGAKLRWRLHYRDVQDRIQIIAGDHNPEALLVDGAEVIPYAGKGNHPKRSKQQHYKLIPCVDQTRIACVRFLFKIVREQYPVAGPSSITRQVIAMGFRSYNGRSFDIDCLMDLLTDETYIGVRPYGKRSVARHKRFNKNTVDAYGQHLEDVAENEKGMTVWRTKDEIILPDHRTHDALVSDEEFAAVQEALAKKPKKGTLAPRSESGWLKPVLYCAGCGRGMICRTYHGKPGYICKTYGNYRYQRPGDDRFNCAAGLNWIRHDLLEKFLSSTIDLLRDEYVELVETAAIKRLETKVVEYESIARKGATLGLRNYLRLIYDALECDDRPMPFGTRIEELLKVDDSIAQEAGLREIEQALPKLVAAALEQCEGEHRDFTVGMSRKGVTARQVQVLDEECRRLEARMQKLQQLLTPYHEQIESLKREYADRVAELEDAKKAFEQGQGRAKGAALSRYYSRIIIGPVVGDARKKAERENRLILALPFWDQTMGTDFDTPQKIKDFMVKNATEFYQSVLYRSSAQGSPRM